MIDDSACGCSAAALLTNLADAVAVVNAAGVLTYASPAVESLLGVRPDQMVGRNAFDLVHPDDQLDAFEGFESTVSSTGSRPTPLLVRLQHASGAWIETELIATNHLEDGTIAGLLLAIRDVSASMRTEQSLRDSEERYRLIVELAHEGILMVDNRGTITFANRALARMLRTSVPEMVGRSVLEFMDVNAGVRAARFAERGESTDEASDFRLLAADGTCVWVRISANPLRLHDGTRNGVVAVVTDITERRVLEAQLAHDARHDALTGLANRHTLFDALVAQLAHTHACAVLFADLDHFKQINDMHGHQIGDEVLKIAAARITGTVRNVDTVARVGGDEFVIVCAPIRDRAEAVDIGARVVAAFNDPIGVGDTNLTLSISVGLALATPGDDADTILARADHALYAAKRAGRNALEVETSS